MSEREQFGFNFEQQMTGQEIVKRAFDEVMQETFREIDQELDTELAEEVVDPPEATHVELEKNGQIPLINIGEWWEEHWRGMPEFEQKDLMPWKTVYVHFNSRESMDEFSQLVDQKIGLNTKYIWYPKATIVTAENKRWVDAMPDASTLEDEESE